MMDGMRVGAAMENVGLVVCTTAPMTLLNGGCDCGDIDVGDAGTGWRTNRDGGRGAGGPMLPEIVDVRGCGDVKRDLFFTTEEW